MGCRVIVVECCLALCDQARKVIRFGKSKGPAYVWLGQACQMDHRSARGIVRGARAESRQGSLSHGQHETVPCHKRAPYTAPVRLRLSTCGCVHPTRANDTFDFFNALCSPLAGRLVWRALLQPGTWSLEPATWARREERPRVYIVVDTLSGSAWLGLVAR